MKKFFNWIFRKSFYESIPYEDLMSRQRFTLFRIFTYTAFLASTFSALQIQALYTEVHFLAASMFVLAMVILVNFLRVKNQDQLPVAYTISVLSGFLVVHMQSYYSGGLMNAGTMYLCVLIMTAFMLLGTKAGKWVTGLAVLSIAFLFYATEYTNWTSYELFKNDPALIHQDAIVTFLLAVLLVAAQSNYLHSGKNVIIERITLQKDQLEISNRKLQDYTVHLERTNKELDKFASIVSHDLKAPLRAIGNLTGWIEEDGGDTLIPEVRANFNMIKQRVKRMEDLINAILDYSRADRRVSDDVEINTRELVIDTLDFIGKPENVQLHVSEKLPVIVSDKTRLSQIFSNLLSNGIKYNDKKEIRLDVDVEVQADGWIFSVKDNGPGIEEQYQEKIFVIFQTLNRRDDVESTGVGLAIVKKIIEDQGGKIWVESALGEGSTFKFFWPREQKELDPVIIAAPILV